MELINWTHLEQNRHVFMVFPVPFVKRSKKLKAVAVKENIKHLSKFLDSSWAEIHPNFRCLDSRKSLTFEDQRLRQQMNYQLEGPVKWQEVVFDHVLPSQLQDLNINSPYFLPYFSYNSGWWELEAKTSELHCNAGKRKRPSRLRLRVWLAERVTQAFRINHRAK